MCLYGIAASGICDAQLSMRGESEIYPVPETPQSYVLDKANLFLGHPEKLVEVQASLSRLEQQHDYPVYLAIYYNVYDVSLQEVADAFYDAWIGESRRGMVIVYQLDPVISGSNPATAYYLGSGLDPALSDRSMPGPIPSQDVATMLKKVLKSKGRLSTDHHAYISGLIHGIEGEIDRYHEIEPMRWNDAQNLKWMAIFLALMSALTVIGVFSWRLFSPLDDKARKVYYFPEVNVGQRLGAPYGGGQISEKTFVPASSRQ